MIILVLQLIYSAVFLICIITSSLSSSSLLSSSKSRAFQILQATVFATTTSLLNAAIIPEDSKINNSPYKVYKNACFSKTSSSGHNVNSVEEYESSLPKLPGLTYWINDYLAVGHLMYDIVLLELVATQRIDSVVLQRAPCFTRDLCAGSGGGTLSSFYQTYFTLLTAVSLNKKLLIYFRANPRDTFWRPLDVSAHSRMVSMINKNSNSSSSSTTISTITTTSWIPVKDKTCFSSVITRSCQSCFHDIVSSSTVQLFQAEIQRLLGKNKISASPNSQKSSSFRITYGYRGPGHYRELASHLDLLLNLTNAIKKFYPHIEVIANYSGFIDVSDNAYGLVKSSKSTNRDRNFNNDNDNHNHNNIKQVLISVVDTSNFANPRRQIEVTHLTDVMISTHGAFESNLIYMRKNKTWVEFSSESLKRESTDFAHLAKSFLVNHKTIVAEDLKSRKQMSYRLSYTEEKVFIGLVLSSIKMFIL